MKLAFWYRYPAGMAPVLIGVLFFSSVQLFFTGILGEYIGAILTQVQKRPLVIEKERINFAAEEATAIEAGPIRRISAAAADHPPTGRQGPLGKGRIASAA